MASLPSDVKCAAVLVLGRVVHAVPHCVDNPRARVELNRLTTFP